MDLWVLILKEKWSDFIERITSHPEEVQSWNNGFLYIHRACDKPNIPVEVVEALIKVHPQSVKQPDKVCCRIPLHIAVGHASSTKTDVVSVLLHHYKEGVSMRNEQGHTPLIYHLCFNQCPSLVIVKMLVEAYPEAVSTRDDKFQWYPLHFAALCNNWDISKYLIEVYPEALLKKNKSGRTPRGVADTFGIVKISERFHAEEKKRNFSIPNMPVT